MRLHRIGRLFVLLLTVVLISSCGSGTKTDTSGSLTLSSPTKVDNTDGTYFVSTKVTYTPPAGKVPNGVVINIKELEDGIIVQNFNDTLTDSNTVDHSFTVKQSTLSSVRVDIIASIGDMTSSVAAIVPALAAVSATPIQYLQTDPAGTVKTTTISGGIAPYTLVSSSTPELTVSLTGATFSATTRNLPGPTGLTQEFTVSDSKGNLGTVQVNFF